MPVPVVSVPVVAPVVVVERAPEPTVEPAAPLYAPVFVLPAEHQLSGCCIPICSPSSISQEAVHVLPPSRASPPAFKSSPSKKNHHQLYVAPLASVCDIRVNFYNNENLAIAGQCLPITGGTSGGRRL